MASINIHICHNNDFMVSNFSLSKSSPIPQPSAVIIFLISSDFKILSSLDFQHLKSYLFVVK